MDSPNLTNDDTYIIDDDSNSLSDDSSSRLNSSLESCSLPELLFLLPDHVWEWGYRAPSMEHLPLEDDGVHNLLDSPSRSSPSIMENTSTEDGDVSQDVESSLKSESLSSLEKTPENLYIIKGTNENFPRQRSMSFQPANNIYASNSSTARRTFSESSIGCGYCLSVGNPSPYSHSKSECEWLCNMNPCKVCGAFGADNHTETYCPSKRPVKLSLDHKYLEESRRRSSQRIENYMTKYSEYLKDLDDSMRHLLFLHD